MLNVNPNILKWARETAGLSQKEAVAKLNLKVARGVEPVARLEALESGQVQPSRPMLVKMAKQYRRPLLTFYLSTPPKLGNRGEDFRTLPETVELFDRALVDVVIRDIRARQALVKDVLLGEGEPDELQFIGSVNIKDGVSHVLERITQQIGFSQQEFRQQQRMDEAFAYLRNLSEKIGIFVLLVDNLGSHHTSISVEAFRGFALSDPIAPFVAVNANDSRGAWSFTLLHELTHLFLGATGVSGTVAQRTIERFCNDVASELLVSKAELTNLQFAPEADFAGMKAEISAFANLRNVSSTMIAYKLYRTNAFDYEKFLTFRDAYRQDYLDWRALNRARGRENNTGPSYYVVRQHRLGNALVRLVERMVYGGSLTTTKAGKVLGVGAKNVQGVIEVARSGHRPESA